MKFGITSDIHREFNPVWDEMKSVRDEVDMFIFAGDIDVGIRGLEWAESLEKESVYVMGNHEYYNGVFETVKTQAVNFSNSSKYVSLLNNNVIYKDDVRILGCTLWTDYNLYNPSQNPIDRLHTMQDISMHLNDHRVIRGIDGSSFSPLRAAAENECSVRWLEKEILTGFDGKTVVVTHHCPSAKGINPRFNGDFMNPAFHSNLEYLMEGVDLWVYGHTHYDADFIVGDCRVVSCQLGYADRRGNTPERYVNGQGQHRPLIVEI